MKIRGGIYRKVGKIYIGVGYSFSRFFLGFSISKNHFDLELAFFWIGVEF